MVFSRGLRSSAENAEFFGEPPCTPLARMKCKRWDYIETHSPRKLLFTLG